MALLDAILPFAEVTATKIAALATVTSSSEQVAGPRRIFSIVGTGQFNIRFGPVGAVTNAAATDFFIPANTIATLATDTNWSSFKVFNPGGSSIDIYWIPMGLG